MKLALAGFLVVHALIHASFLTPAPPRTAGGPEWPFEMSRSWLVTNRPAGMVRKRTGSVDRQAYPTRRGQSMMTPER